MADGERTRYLSTMTPDELREELRHAQGERARTACEDMRTVRLLRRIDHIESLLRASNRMENKVRIGFTEEEMSWLTQQAEQRGETPAEFIHRMVATARRLERDNGASVSNGNRGTSGGASTGM